MSTDSMTPEGETDDLATEKPDAWDRILADPRLDRARSKLSIHELRAIISHVKAANPVGHDLTATMQAILRLVEAPGIHSLQGMTREEWVAYARPKLAALTPKP